MSRAGFCLFDTPLGPCGIAWREDGRSDGGRSDGGPSVVRPAVTLLQLPEVTTERTKATMARASGAPGPSAPPPPIVEIIERLRKHLEGEAQDLRDIVVDLTGADDFARQVYEAAREIPAGQTRTYGEIARALGQPREAQAVGQALGKNPIALIIPCHRVVAAGGKPGGFSAHGGRATKVRLLAVEGAPTPPIQLELRPTRKR
jgi:O-6-methylguanine DNA methyltransferase